MVADRCFDTAQEKAVDELIDSHGYTDACLTPQDDGSVTVFAEKPALTWNGRWRLTARVGVNGEVTDVLERDW